MPTLTPAHPASKTSLSVLRNLSTLLLAVPLFCVGLSARAQTPGPLPTTAARPSSTPTPVAPRAAYPPQDGATHVGVQMHGWWTIDIRNPDGKLVEHREFENSLAQTGDNYLIGLMSGVYLPGNYAVELLGAPGPCLLGGQGSGGCALVTNLTTLPGSSVCSNYYCATGLTVTPNLTGSGTSTLTIAGSATANQAGNINFAYVVASPCYNATQTVETNAPSTCPVGGGSGSSAVVYPLSGTNLTTVNVANGQIIQVTVVISFS